MCYDAGMSEDLSEDAERALRMVADHEARRVPIAAAELGTEDLNDLCAAGLVELTIANDVYVTLSPGGRLRARESAR